MIWEMKGFVYMEREKQVHTIDPVYDSRSRVLILGSFPSVASREAGFFYGHPANRFWRVMAAVFSTSVPSGVDEKRAFLLSHGVAVWDVVASCRIAGSSDASMTEAVPNDIGRILSAAPIRGIFVNGKTAEKYYRRYLLPACGREAVCLPSTSPANAALSLFALTERWRAEILGALSD